MKYTHIIWDFNGTLLDDVSWCVKVINRMLIKRGLKPFSSVEDYHKVFRFPVVDYYKNIGFDFDEEPFSVLAEEFIADYHADNGGDCKLHKNAQSVMRSLHEQGLKQIILSASEINNLKEQLARFDITRYLDQILGISDIYAGSKLELAVDFIRLNNLDPKKVLLIGDTGHDFDVAKELNADCVLISSGHQSREKLLECGVAVLDDISEVTEYLC